MVCTQTLYIVIAILSLFVVGLAVPLGIYIQKCGEHSENLCLCRNGGLEMKCVDRQKKMQLYNAGLTEHSVL